MGTQIRTPLPVYNNGTVSGNSGTPVITGVGTNWTTLDANNNTINSVMGGDLFITASGPIPIKSVDSATQITLESNLSATINAGSAYRIVKYSANQTGGVTTALANVLLQGSDGTPDASRTIDSGAGRVKLRIGGAGDAQIAVGLTGVADAALVTAIDMSQAGVVTFPVGASISSIYGRNSVINGNFLVNQKNVSGTVTLTAGQIGHDRWKAGAGGCTYTFQTPGNDTLITITAGSLLQVVEASNFYGTGVSPLTGQNAFIASWFGTSTCRVYLNGSSSFPAYAASPIDYSYYANNQIVLEFNPGTLSYVQFEPLYYTGQPPTRFERRQPSIEFGLCQRYAQIISASLRFYATGANQYQEDTIIFTNMRLIPTATLLSAPTRSNISLTTSGFIIPVTSYAARFNLYSSGAGDAFALNDQWFLNAEI